MEGLPQQRLNVFPVMQDGYACNSGLRLRLPSISSVVLIRAGEAHGVAILCITSMKSSWGWYAMVA
jgi:O-antigen ligase